MLAFFLKETQMSLSGVIPTFRVHVLLLEAVEASFPLLSRNNCVMLSTSARPCHQSVTRTQLATSQLIASYWRRHAGFSSAFVWPSGLTRYSKS